MKRLILRSMSGQYLSTLELEALGHHWKVVAFSLDGEMIDVSNDGDYEQSSPFSEDLKVSIDQDGKEREFEMFLYHTGHCNLGHFFAMIAEKYGPELSD